MKISYEKSPQEVNKYINSRIIETPNLTFHAQNLLLLKYQSVGITAVQSKVAFLINIIKIVLLCLSKCFHIHIIFVTVKWVIIGIENV